MENKKKEIKIKEEVKQNNDKKVKIGMYDGNKCIILKKNKDEVLIKCDVYDYLLGYEKEIKQWVKEKDVK